MGCTRTARLVRFFSFGMMVAVAGALWPAGARADGMAHDGGFVGVGLAYGVQNFDDLPGLVDEEDSFGLDVRGGYRWPHVAAELAIQFFPSFDVARGDGRYRGLLVGPNIKGYPLSTGGFQPYGLLGLGLNHIDGKDVGGPGNDYEESSFMLRFGAGMELYVTEGVALYGEGFYSLDTKREADMVPFLGGLQFHF